MMQPAQDFLDSNGQNLNLNWFTLLTSLQEFWQELQIYLHFTRWELSQLLQIKKAILFRFTRMLNKPL